MRDLPDIHEEHCEAVNDHGFEWGDDFKSPSTLYSSCFERWNFRMLQEGSTDRFEYYEPGNFVSVNLPSKEGPGRGDAYAPSIARIEAVFEDARRCCHVALRYFWRWGQIHAGADLHHAMRPRFRAQLFLQKEVTVGTEGRGGPDSHNTLRYADGCFKEVLPAIQLNQRVTVLSKADVVRGFGGRHADSVEAADVAAALAKYEANWRPQDATDPDSGARSNGFWFDSTFDQTCYKFEAATPEDLPDIQLPGTPSKQQQQQHSRRQRQQLQEQPKLSTAGAAAAAAGASAPLSDSQDGAVAVPGRFQRLHKELGLTMGDAFCGLGTVSIAANEVGWQVEFGIDSSRDAMASFRANTAHSTAAPFNTVTDRPPVDLPPQRVEQVVAQLRSGRLALPAVDWLHLSPPCQNVSQKKKLEDRVFSGAELRSAVELVGLLQPSFVTLEEVPGFLVQKFLPHNLKGELAGYPNQPSGPQHSSSSAPGAAPGASLQHDGDHDHEEVFEDDCEDDGEDDQEGEGLADVAGEEGTEEDQAAAAAGDSSRSSASGPVLLNPVLLVVPALLDLGYQLRLCLLNAACYGAPQIRHRVVLLAAKHGCQLPDPPLPRYALPDGARCLPRLAATDTGFLCKAGGSHGDWLEVLPQQPGALPPAITLQEACGDLPPLNSPSCRHNSTARAAAAVDQQCCSGAGQSGIAAGGQQQRQQAASAAKAPRAPAVWLGEEVVAYRPEAGLMNCPLPLEALQERGCRPVSRFSRWARSPHAPHQALRGFSPSLLADHSVKHPGSGKVEQLLAAPDWDTAASTADKQRVERMSVRERAQLKRAGRRLAADGLMQCVLGHNEPVRFCVHFSEDRWTSLAERRRGQSLPDWVVIKGNDKHREQQVGNAVPYLLAAEVAAAVWQAATGEPGRRPPQLNGPCPEGTGIADPLLLAQHYVPWLQQQQAAGGGWGGVLQACRQQLQQEARALQEQQRRNREAALQQQEQALLLSTQQVSSPKQQVLQTTQKQQQQQRKQHKQKPSPPQQQPQQQKKGPQQEQRPREAPQVPGNSRKRPRGAAGVT